MDLFYMDIQAVYIKLRITLDEDVYDETNAKTNDHYGPRKLKSTLAMLTDNGYIQGKMTSGYEKMGKTGDYVKPHIHIHFKTTTKKDTIRKSITRYWEKQYEEKLSGNKMWSLQIEPYVVEDKFFCYPLKQQDENNPPPSIGYEKDEILAMTRAAKMTAAIATEVAQKKGARREEADTLYDRLEAHLDKGQGTVGDILEFYMKENKPINDTTIVGYYNLYRLKRDRITCADYAEKLISKYGI